MVLEVRALVRVACAGLLVGCAPSDEVAADWPMPDTAIKGGTPDEVSTSVLAVGHAAQGSLCSGTLIAPNVVLTARHCVSTSDGDEGVVCGVTTFEPPWAAGGFFLTSAPEVDLANFGEFRVEAVVPLSGALAIPPHDADDLLFCGNDVAALILKENVAPEVAVPIEPRFEPVETGELFSAIGYGAVDGEGNEAGVRRRLDEVDVVCRGTDCMGAGFEANDVHAAEWVGGGGVCGGDSGGPALDAQGRIIGVTSRGDADCNISLYAGIPDYGSWLSNVVMLASGMGDYAPPNWTEGATVDRAWGFEVGFGCTEDAECPSGICVPNGAAGYCSRPCAEEAPCPNGFVCRERDGASICAFPPSSSGGTPLAPVRSDDGCNVSAASAAPSRDLGWLVLLALGLRRRR